MLAECMEMSARVGDALGEALSAYTLGEVCRWRGDERAALDRFMACYALLGSYGEHVWYTRTREQIARSRTVLGRHRPASAGFRPPRSPNAMPGRPLGSQPSQQPGDQRGGRGEQRRHHQGRDDHAEQEPHRDVMGVVDTDEDP